MAAIRSNGDDHRWQVILLILFEMTIVAAPLIKYLRASGLGLTCSREMQKPRADKYPDSGISHIFAQVELYEYESYTLIVSICCVSSLVIVKTNIIMENISSKNDESGHPS